MKKEDKNLLMTSSVLLVEDDFRIREKFSRLLKIYIGTVYEASSGKEALEMYKKNEPSFIITDVEMRNINGLEMVKTIRQTNSQIPIIIVSAYSHKEYLFESIKLGLVDYLIKPISIDSLMASLETVAELLKRNKVTNLIEVNGSIYNPQQKIIKFDEETIFRLTSIESKLLELLVLNKGNIITKHKVESEIYAYKEMSDAALKNLVFKLRKKLPEDTILSVDKLGYMIK